MSTTYTEELSRRDFLIAAGRTGLAAMVAAYVPLTFAKTSTAASGVPCDQVCEGVSKDPAILADALKESRFHLLTYAEDNALNEPFIGVKRGTDLDLHSLLNIRLRDGEQVTFKSYAFPALDDLLRDGKLTVNEQDRLFAEGYHRIPIAIETPRDATSGWIALDTVAYAKELAGVNNDLLERLALSDCNREYDLRTEDRKVLAKAMGDYMLGINNDKIDDAVAEYVQDKAGKRYIAFSVRVFGDSLKTKQKDLPTRARQQVGWNTDDKQFGGKGENALPIERWYDAKDQDGHRILDTMTMLRIMDKSGNQWYMMNHGDYRDIESKKVRGEPNALNNSLLANHWVGIRNGTMYELARSLWPESFVPKALWKGNHDEFRKWIQYDDGNPRYPGMWRDGQPIDTEKLNPGYNCCLAMGHERLPAVLDAVKKGSGIFRSVENVRVPRNQDTYTFK